MPKQEQRRCHTMKAMVDLANQGSTVCNRRRHAFTTRCSSALPHAGGYKPPLLEGARLATSFIRIVPVRPSMP